MKEEPKHISEQFCSNCLHYTLTSDSAGTCCNPLKSHFHDYPQPEYWCVHHELDINKKNQKRGKI